MQSGVRKQEQIRLIVINSHLKISQKAIGLGKEPRFYLQKNSFF
jgi:hypothetical protein